MKHAFEVDKWLLAILVAIDNDRAQGRSVMTPVGLGEDVELLAVVPRRMRLHEFAQENIHEFHQIVRSDVPLVENRIAVTPA
jgi:hypothetical protein